MSKMHTVFLSFLMALLFFTVCFMIQEVSFLNGLNIITSSFWHYILSSLTYRKVGVSFQEISGKKQNLKQLLALSILY